jgi:hypothetical protein
LKPLLLVGAAFVVVGGVISLAPFVLPRSVFGGLGDGDGMGLIGLFLIGAFVSVGGVALMAIAALLALSKSARRSGAARD